MEAGQSALGAEDATNTLLKKTMEALEKKLTTVRKNSEDVKRKKKEDPTKQLQPQDEIRSLPDKNTYNKDKDMEIFCSSRDSVRTKSALRVPSVSLSAKKTVQFNVPTVKFVFDYSSDSSDGENAFFPRRWKDVPRKLGKRRSRKDSFDKSHKESCSTSDTSKRKYKTSPFRRSPSKTFKSWQFMGTPP